MTNEAYLQERKDCDRSAEYSRELGGGSPSGKKDIPCVYVLMKKIVNVENQGFQVVLSDCATQTIPRRRWRRLDVETGVRIIEIEGVEPPL